MFPILYDHIERDSNREEAPRLIVPEHYGLGVLSDAISCVVEQVRNDIYELVMEYPMTGIHAEEFATDRWLKAKPNFTDDPQLFKIKRVGKTMSNGHFLVYAQHNSYAMSGYIIKNGMANNAASACVLLRNATNKDFDIVETDKDVSGNFVITEPSSVKSWFAGKKGSFLDVFGTAEIKYDNFRANFMLHAGADRGVQIRYKKNLLELSQEIDSSNLYTAVFCYYKPSEGETICGNEVSTGLTMDTPKVLAVDVTSNYPDDIPTEQQLTDDATAYKNSHNLTVPTNNITLDFAQSENLTGRVDLCDTVSIYYEALGITRANVKCIRTKWDVLKEKYIETEFGDVKTSLADTIADNTTTADNAKSAAESALNAVGSKKRVFTTTPVPPYDIGDLWTNTDDIYVCVVKRILGEEYSIENDWVLASDYVNQNYVDENAKKITGNKGGYVMLHDSDGDGNPDEILIVDDPDLTKATQVWRWNKNGLGYANQYDAEHYGLAIYPTGEINANFIKTGKLNAAIVEILHLTAKMFEGAEIALGGTDNGNGVFILRNEDNIEIGRIDIEGLKFWGKGPVGARPYVKLDLNGLSGYDANNNMIFKVEEDEFIMKKCVAQQEINACGRIKFVPVTTSTNSGVAIVKI